VVLRHPGDHLGRRQRARGGLLVALRDHQHHEPHRSASSSPAIPGGYGLVPSGPASASWRISSSPSYEGPRTSAWALMKSSPSRIPPSRALRPNIAYPPTSSLASLNGPSITVSFPRPTRTRAPRELGSRPPMSTSVLDRIASSVSLPMAAISSGGGGWPAS